MTHTISYEQARIDAVNNMGKIFKDRIRKLEAENASLKAAQEPLQISLMASLFLAAFLTLCLIAA